MNKKVTIQNGTGKLAYCILSGEQNFKEQFNQFYFGFPNPQHGMCVHFDGKEVAVVDDYHRKKVAALQVVGIEDTDTEPVYARIDWD